MNRSKIGDGAEGEAVASASYASLNARCARDMGVDGLGGVEDE